jgi:hypothetical protein
VLAAGLCCPKTLYDVGIYIPANKNGLSIPAPEILPVIDTLLTVIPELATITTSGIPPTPVVTLPPELTTVTFDVPELMFATLVITPVNSAPFPKM